jgi:ABC-type nitrate/sulfonate/bicarbonate transport system permease component
MPVKISITEEVAVQKTQGHRGQRALRDISPSATSDLEKPAQRLKRIVFISLLAIWALATESGVVHSVYLPSPSDVLAAFWSLVSGDQTDLTLMSLMRRHSFVEQVCLTATRLYVSLVIGAVGGVVVGLAAGHSRRWHATFKGAISVVGTTPRIFLLSLLAVGIYPFGPLLGTTGIIVIGTVVSFLYLGNTAYEIARNREYKEYIEAARIDGANWVQIYVLIVLPIAKPALMAATRVALWSALGITYFAEWMIAPNGMGIFLSTTVSISRMPELFAIILTGYLLVLPGSLALSLWEKRP